MIFQLKSRILISKNKKYFNLKNKHLYMYKSNKIKDTVEITERYCFIK